MMFEAAGFVGGFDGINKIDTKYLFYDPRVSGEVEGTKLCEGEKFLLE